MSDIMNLSPLWGVWHLKERMGRGAFGSVYRAVKTEYGNSYISAVKHISIPAEDADEEDLDGEGFTMNDSSRKQYYDYLRDQIIKEINLCYTLRGNSNIVSYEDHCILPKASGYGYDIFIRMEFLVALNKYIRNHPISEDEVIRLGMEMCDALDVLNKHHIIHRDIKPANIFINPLGTYKLGDFGESKVLSGHSIGMTIRGTYTYMSPEISRGASADVRADLYSLGLVMYRLLNGNKSPFVPLDLNTPSAQAVETANIRRFKGERIPLPAYCSDPELINIIMKACEYLPQERWQTPQEMKMALMILQYRRQGKTGNSILPFLPMQEKSSDSASSGRSVRPDVSSQPSAPKQDMTTRQPSEPKREMTTRQPSEPKQDMTTRQPSAPKREKLTSQPAELKRERPTSQPAEPKQNNQKGSEAKVKKDAAEKKPDADRSDANRQNAPKGAAKNQPKEKKDPSDHAGRKRWKEKKLVLSKEEYQRMLRVNAAKKFLKDQENKPRTNIQQSRLALQDKTDIEFGRIKKLYEIRGIAAAEHNLKQSIQLKGFQKDWKYLQMGIDFYRDVFSLSDEKLKQQGYTRNEVLENLYFFMEEMGFPIAVKEKP